MRKLILVSILGLHAVILFFLQFTAWPEMLSYPYLLSKGFVLYKDFVVPYTPGLFLIFSGIFSLFKFDPYILKASTVVSILSVDLLVYLNLSRVSKSKISLFFLLGYVILQPLFDGDMMWFDFATTPFLLIALYYANIWLERKKSFFLILIGLFFSLAILIKQIAFVYPLGFILFCLLIDKKQFHKQKLSFLGGLTLLFIPFVFYLLITGSFSDFWNFAFYYPLFEWSKFPGYVALGITKKQALILLLPFIPISFAIFKFKKMVLENTKILLTFVFLVCAILAIYPRFSYFHFQPSLALIIILIFQIYHLLNRRLKVFQVSLLIIIVLLEVYLIRPVNIDSGIRFYTGDVQNLAKWIKNNTNEQEKIYLFGPDSSLYALSGRVPPKPWIDTFGWYLEIPGVQDRLLDGFKKTPPTFIFYSIPLIGNWFDLGVYKPEKVVNFMHTNYNKIGLFDGIEIWKIK